MSGYVVTGGIEGKIQEADCAVLLRIITINRNTGKAIVASRVYHEGELIPSNNTGLEENVFALEVGEQFDYFYTRAEAAAPSEADEERGGGTSG